jgi:transposase-like protein
MGKPRNKLNPERQRTRFSKDFKLEAVRLLELGHKPATQLALELGINRNQLYKVRSMGSDSIEFQSSDPVKARSSAALSPRQALPSE